ncbi:MAG: GDP-mannose 4,6-dehydratase [Actinomycetota bacterium]
MNRGLEMTANGQYRRVLVTGGAGFIGSHLARALRARGVVVTVVDDFSTGRLANIADLDEDAGFTLVHGSVCDQELMDRLVADSDIVFHLAAAVGVQLVVEDALTTIETNVMGTETVLKAAVKGGGVKVMLASTSEVYGKCVKLPASEDDDVLLGASRNSRWSYAASKMVDEFLALAYQRQRGLPVVVFRLFNTVGPRQSGRYGMVIPRFVAAALAGEPLPVHGDGGQSRSFLHVEDAIRGILALAKSPEAIGEVFNIGSSEEVTIREVAQRVLEGVGRAGSADSIEFISYEEAYAPGFEDIRRRVADTSKLRECTGWAPRRSLDDILGDVIADLRADDVVVAQPRRNAERRLAASG